MAESGLAIAARRAACRRLSVGEKQRVEILKVLYRDARILVLDEPTAVLTPQEVDGLFAVLRRLAASGLAVVFISHKLGRGAGDRRSGGGAARRAQGRRPADRGTPTGARSPP